jgi:prephenate dehydrogenase
MQYTPRHILIYSVGLLGASLGSALKKSGFTGRITGLSSEKNRATALELGCIDEGFGYEALADRAPQADCIFLCSPIHIIGKTVAAFNDIALRDTCIVTDIGSTKQDIMQRAHTVFANTRARFIGGHPMAGSEKSGPGASDPYIFQNAIYALTPFSESPDERDRAFAAFLERYLGCSTLFLSPTVHDQIAATISHVPHILSVALVLLAADMQQRREGTLQLAAGGFRDMTRIAASPYRMWHDILTTNTGYITECLDRYIDILTRMKTHLHQGSLQKEFDSACRVKKEMPTRQKGFFSPLNEVLVTAPDRPGVIASIARHLAAYSININDIEVLKVREGEGGTIKLAFSSATAARRAVRILTDNGFSARERK